jgi:hypothetical protein
MASKRGPLSKSEIFYVVEHAKIGKDINEISSDLDRPVKSIEKYYINAIKKSINVNHFVSSKGSTIMTETASSISDAKRSFKTSKKAPNTKCVTKIKNNE